MLPNRASTISPVDRASRAAPQTSHSSATAGPAPHAAAPRYRDQWRTSPRRDLGLHGHFGEAELLEYVGDINEALKLHRPVGTKQEGGLPVDRCELGLQSVSAQRLFTEMDRTRRVDHDGLRL